MKLRTICTSKIHHAVVTAADLNYIGSIGIDESLMRMTGIIAGEQVSVWIVVDERNRFVQRLPVRTKDLAEAT